MKSEHSEEGVVFQDRRKRPTPILSRYTLNGRRQGFIGAPGLPKEGYVDRYGPEVLFALVLLSGLNCLDSFLTMKILALGGRELNPVMDFLIGLTGEKFWLWKFFAVSLCSVFLCLHVHFKRVKWVIAFICLLYLIVITYQLVGLHLLEF
jgi:hypothetical protein